jgi:hypothetical protein
MPLRLGRPRGLRRAYAIRCRRATLRGITAAVRRRNRLCRSEANGLADEPREKERRGLLYAIELGCRVSNSLCSPRCVGHVAGLPVRAAGCDYTDLLRLLVLHIKYTKVYRA